MVTPRSRKLIWLTALVVPSLALAAWLRTGMLDLPSLPRGLTREAAGLSGLDELKKLNAAVWSAAPPTPVVAPDLAKAVALVHQGIATQHGGDTSKGLEQMREGIRLAPDNLVLANAYRMIVFTLRRDFLAASRRDSVLTPKFPPELDRQPIVFFEELDRSHTTRETKLHLACAWVDEMLLFPPLEIKAPASVQAVNLLSTALEKNPDYVPALFARGLNHLHRPSRLVWPESAKTRPDAAAQDLGRCVAIGRRFNAGSPRLQATLALSLGDAYVKTGRLSVARSWWQVAQNLCRDADLQAAVHRRYGWQNEEILDRLEEELDQCRAELEHPMTDLALMWN
jgi:hypothetical protein